MVANCRPTPALHSAARRCARKAKQRASSACAGSERLDPTPAQLTDKWSGEAIVSRICGRKDQPLAIEIASDGRVTGTRGGAAILNSYMVSKRGSCGRAIDLKTDYILRGALDGRVIEGEPAPSTFFIAPFNLIEKPHERPHVCSGLTTCDNPHGGKSPLVGAHDLVRRRK